MEKYNLIGNKEDSSKMNAVPPNYYNYPNNQPYMYNPNFTPGFPMNNFQFPMYNYNQFPMNAHMIYPPQQNPYYNMQQQFEKPTKRGKKKREDNAPSTAADTNPEIFEREQYARSMQMNYRKQDLYNDEEEDFDDNED